jgi:hypothetical protein
MSNELTKEEKIQLAVESEKEMTEEIKKYSIDKYKQRCKEYLKRIIRAKETLESLERDYDSFKEGGIDLLSMTL